MNSIWTLDTIRKEFDKKNCKLLTETYKNTHEKLTYIAQCGHEHSSSFDNFKADKGLLCKKCRYKSIGDKQRFNYIYVKEYFEHENCLLISNNYIGASTKLKYVAQCGHNNSISFDKFKLGGGRVCNKCSKSIRYEYDYVYEYFLNNDCLLLEKEYINCKTPMRYIAQCGHEHITIFDTFKNLNSSKRCPDCQKVKHHSINEVKEIFEKEDCKLLSVKYNHDISLLYIAQCGHENTIRLDKFLTGQGRKCNKCCKPKGEQHFNYNSLLTDEERIQNRNLYEVIKWRNDVYRRDNFICKKCGSTKGNNLNAHHMSGYNIDKQNRFNIDNGITLCKVCHNDFHKTYGYGNNTKIQFNKWLGGNL